MKLSLFAALLLLSTVNVHAIPPVPPSPIKSGPVVLNCKDLNALTEEDIEDLNQDPERIVSVDHELREVCFKEN